MLDEEQKAAMLESIGHQFEEPSSNILSVDATQGGEIQESQSQPEEAEEVKKVDVKPEEASDPEEPKVQPDNDPKGHAVPYNRFKNVLEARNSFRSEAAGYKTQLSSLEQKLQALQQSHEQVPQQSVKEEDSWLDEFLAEEDAPAEWQGQYQSLNDRLYKFEVAQEERSLRVELDSITKQYPSVPEQYLLQSVVKDPSVDLNKAAEEYHTFISGIQEDAISRYLGDNAPTPPPRVKSGKGTSPARTNMKPDAAPKTLKDASLALKKALSNNKLF